MTNPSTKGRSRYDYLLALNVGESTTFPNLPTAAEARRKVKPSGRRAYFRVRSGLSHLMAVHNVAFSTKLNTSKGSRIDGNQIIVTAIQLGEQQIEGDGWDDYEKRRQRAIDAWKLRKQAEDAPKLKGQLAEAEQTEQEQRLARAKARATVVVRDRPLYDPIKLAELVAHFTKGGAIQQLRTLDGVWINDPSPTWTLPTAQYRKKPLVREFFLIVSRDGHVTAGASDPNQLPHHDPACRVHVREMLPEEEQ